MIKSCDYLKSSLRNIEKNIFLFNNLSCKIPCKFHLSLQITRNVIHKNIKHLGEQASKEQNKQKRDLGLIGGCQPTYRLTLSVNTLVKHQSSLSRVLVEYQPRIGRYVADSQPYNPLVDTGSIVCKQSIITSPMDHQHITVTNTWWTPCSTIGSKSK